MEQITPQDTFTEVKDKGEISEKSTTMLPEPDGALKAIESENSTFYAEDKEIRVQLETLNNSLESPMERMILMEGLNDISFPNEEVKGYNVGKITLSSKENISSKGQNSSAFQPKDRGDSVENYSKDMNPPRTVNTQDDVPEAHITFSPNITRFSSKSQNISALLHPRGGGDSPSFFTFPKRMQKTFSSSRKKALNSGMVTQKISNEKDVTTDDQDNSAEMMKDNYYINKAVQDWSIETEDCKFSNTFDFTTESSIGSAISITEKTGLVKETFPYFNDEGTNCLKVKEEQCNYPRIRYTKNYLMQYANCALAYPLPDSLWPFARTQELPLRQCDCSQQTPRYLSGVVPWNLYPNMHHLAFYKTVQFDIDTRRRATKLPY